MNLGESCTLPLYRKLSNLCQHFDIDPASELLVVVAAQLFGRLLITTMLLWQAISIYRPASAIYLIIAAQTPSNKPCTQAIVIPCFDLQQEAYARGLTPTGSLWPDTKAALLRLKRSGTVVRLH